MSMHAQSQQIKELIMALFDQQFKYYATADSISLNYLSAKGVLSSAKSQSHAPFDSDFDDLASRFDIDEELNAENIIPMLYHAALSKVFDEKSSLVNDLEDACELRYGYRHFHSALSKTVARMLY